MAAVRQCLGQRGKWLLIFDNAGEPQDLRRYIPQVGAGRCSSPPGILSGAEWPGPWTSGWDRPESVAFCSSARGGRGGGETQEEKAAAGQLADELGDLPLALEQAGAYIEACGCSIGHYLAMFRDPASGTAKAGPIFHQDYPDTH